ncbi:MAG: hypothetical protein LBK66_11675 [Spirochaetaceae bacterium]|jgi:multidrug transporter EmrE-like cation transporter|nr:hypothetical protein [Spirochaetaceae bacterium]
MRHEKPFSVFITLALFTVILSGCAEIKQFPPLTSNSLTNECALFIIPTNAEVTKINNITGSWKPGVSKVATILVPEGICEIVWQYSSKTKEISASNMEITTNFVAGKMYILSFTLNDIEKNISYSVKEITQIDLNEYLSTEGGKRRDIVKTIILFLIWGGCIFGLFMLWAKGPLEKHPFLSIPLYLLVAVIITVIIGKFVPNWDVIMFIIHNS